MRVWCFRLNSPTSSLVCRTFSIFQITDREISFKREGIESGSSSFIRIWSDTNSVPKLLVLRSKLRDRSCLSPPNLTNWSTKRFEVVLTWGNFISTLRSLKNLFTSSRSLSVSHRPTNRFYIVYVGWVDGRLTGDEGDGSETLSVTNTIVVVETFNRITDKRYLDGMWRYPLVSHIINLPVVLEDNIYSESHMNPCYTRGNIYSSLIKRATGHYRVIRLPFPLITL